LILPAWKWTQRLVISGLFSLMYALVYLSLIVYVMVTGAGGMNFSSLAQIGVLFQSPWALLAGWVHYLAFDLLVGAWEVKDARSRGISHWLLVPCLFFTFMLGPVGLLGYVFLRALSKKQLVLEI
ncbi:MAG: DUF4281 domain-containing protein, partial [Bacteroidetes bacterium]